MKKKSSFGCWNYLERMDNTRVTARQYYDKDNLRLPGRLKRLVLSQKHPTQKLSNKAWSGIPGRRQSYNVKIKKWENLDSSGEWMSRKMDVLLELCGLKERHYVCLKMFPWYINLHFVFIFQKTNHLIYVNLLDYSEIT